MLWQVTRISLLAISSSSVAVAGAGFTEGWQSLQMVIITLLIVEAKTKSIISFLFFLCTLAMKLVDPHCSVRNSEFRVQ